MFNDIDKLAHKSRKILPHHLEKLQVQGGVKNAEYYYRFLYHLVKYRQPKLSIELGLHHGVGSAHMADAARDHEGIVIGIDLNYPSYFLHLYTNFRLILGDSTTSEAIIKEYVKKYGPVGLVFQDSSHHYDQSCKEWDIIYPLLSNDAIWVCDDITESFYRPGLDEKSMVEYFEERPGHKKIYYDLHRGSAIGVILLEK